jgi:murein lipoprotein
MAARPYGWGQVWPSRRHPLIQGEYVVKSLISTHRTLLISSALAVGAATGLAGCASTSDITKLQNEVNQARQEAAAAKQAAAQAQQTANDASKKADQALATAADAKSMAANAQQTANDTNTRLDRMFKKTMNK